MMHLPHSIDLQVRSRMAEDEAKAERARLLENAAKPSLMRFRIASSLHKLADWLVQQTPSGQPHWTRQP